MPKTSFSQDLEKTSSDGTIHVIINPQISSRLTLDVKFQDSNENNLSHVNYDVLASQNGKTILDDIGAHSHTGQATHESNSLESSSDINVVITFRGIGLSQPYTGPIGEKFSFMVSGNNDSETKEDYQTVTPQFTRLTQTILDPIPSTITENQLITFSGRVTTGNNQPVPGVLVYIKEDDTLGRDDFVSIAYTDSDGKYKVDIFSKDWDMTRGDSEIYAVFEGNSNFRGSESLRQKISVQEPILRVVLDPIPQVVKPGQVVEFSGRVISESSIPIGQRIVIIDEDWSDFDDKLADAYLDSQGRFSAQWMAQEKDTGDRRIWAIIADYFTSGQASEVNDFLNSADIGTVEVFAKFYDKDGKWDEKPSPIQLLILEQDSQNDDFDLLSNTQNTDLFLQILQQQSLSDEQVNLVLDILESQNYPYDNSENSIQDSKPLDNSKIPSWVNNTMKWYLDGLTSEDEMISAIQFLVNQGIIKLNQ